MRKQKLLIVFPDISEAEYDTDTAGKEAGEPDHGLEAMLFLKEDENRKSNHGKQEYGKINPPCEVRVPEVRLDPPK